MLWHTDFDLEKVDNIVITNNVMQISKILSGIYHINQVQICYTINPVMLNIGLIHQESKAEQD
jgi:hypothetical protein